MDICFWCKRQKGEGEGDNPEYFDYDYCPECQQKVNLGVTIIQVTETPNGNKPIKGNLYPTGKWVVLDREPCGDIIFINEETWEKMKLPN